MSEPRTAAGRALLDDLAYLRGNYAPMILDIEDEAAASGIVEQRLIQSIEAEAATLPADGLRAALPEGASIAEFRRRVREAIHPTSGMCGKNSTGCRTRHSLATIDCLNLLGRGDFALARLLLHEYDTARAALAIEAQARPAVASEGLRVALAEAVITALDVFGTMGNGEGWTLEQDVIGVLWLALTPEEKARTGYIVADMDARMAALEAARYPVPSSGQGGEK